MSDDKIAALLGEAAETIRDALHDRTQPEWPSVLYERCACFVDLLGKLTQVATTLRDTTERAPQLWNLGSDDDTHATQHVDAACLGLVESAAKLDDAYRLANEAFSSLSHLKAT